MPRLARGEENIYLSKDVGGRRARKIQACDDQYAPVFEQAQIRENSVPGGAGQGCPGRGLRFEQVGIAEGTILASQSDRQGSAIGQPD